MLAGHDAVMWLVFAVTIAVLLLADLASAGRRGQQPTFSGAVRWSIAVVGIAALFGALVWLREGRSNAVQFATGYLVELSLSVDNLLVFLLILDYFAVPGMLHPTVLKWGVLGAIVMRGVMIGGGTLLLNEISWVIYLLGAVLVFTGIRMLARRHVRETSPEASVAVRAIRKLLPVTETFRGKAFLAREAGRVYATPLLVVVLIIEWTDLIFATDSIPAIFAITRDPFLVYTSNIFAIVGLRALFFALAGTFERVRRLRFGVGLVLVFVGLGMLAAPWVRLPPEAALAGVVAILGASAVASRMRSEKDDRREG